jgi:ketosteroid isomerase-like protein
MSRENVEVVRRGLTATLEEDWETALATLHPEAEIVDFDVPDAGIYRGHQGLFDWLTRWSESWDSWRIEDIELREAGTDQVVALFRLIASGRGSGVEVERPDAILYTVRDGLQVRIEYFNDQRQALAAAGLSRDR